MEFCGPCAPGVSSEPKLMTLPGGEKGLIWLAKVKLRGVKGGDSAEEMVAEVVRECEDGGWGSDSPSDPESKINLG